MKEEEDLLDKWCKSLMTNWNQSDFKKTHPKLHTAILGSIREGSRLDRGSTEKIAMIEDTLGSKLRDQIVEWEKLLTTTLRRNLSKIDYKFSDEPSFLRFLSHSVKRESRQELVAGKLGTTYTFTVLGVQEPVLIYRESYEFTSKDSVVTATINREIV